MLSDDSAAPLFLTLGLLFLIGLATDLLGKRTRLPRVTLLLMIGFLIGPSGLGILIEVDADWIDIVSRMALVMVGFLLGGQLTLEAMHKHGATVLSVSGCVTLITIAAVAGGLWLLGVNAELALLLAAISTATDPAASTDVIHETQASGPFTETLLGTVAVDDIWGLLAFSVVLTALAGFGAAGSPSEAMVHGLLEIGGSLAIGVGLGIPMVLLTGRLRPGEPTQAEALGFVFLCSGIAMWMEASYLLAAIVLGATVANLASHHKYAFHEIEGIEWPFLILFFVFAGASLDLAALSTGGLLLAGFVVFRILGRIGGGWLGGFLSNAPLPQRRWIGLALLPQAGVAIGMALVGAQRFPEHAAALLSVAIAATVIFEVVGPILTREALQRNGEIPPQ